jgi:hypothetical protein
MDQRHFGIDKIELLDPLRPLFEAAAKRINAVETRLLLLSSGVNLDAAYRFFSWKIFVDHMATSEDGQYHLEFAKQRSLELSLTDAEFAIHFATDVSLKVQALGLGKHMIRQRWHRLPGGRGNWEWLNVDIPKEMVKPETSQVETPAPSRDSVVNGEGNPAVQRKSDEEADAGNI